MVVQWTYMNAEQVTGFMGGCISIGLLLLCTKNGEEADE